MTSPLPRRISRPGGAPRRFVARLVSPALFDFWASRVSRTLSWDRPLACVVARRKESADAVTLVLRPNAHWRGMQGGQHVLIGAEIDGIRVTRSYSPRRDPGHPRCIEITVRQEPRGRLSTYLCEAAGAGDVLDIGPAFGGMTWAAAGPNPVVMLAAGSGITPMLALLRERAAAGIAAHATPAAQKPEATTLVYWAKTAADRCFASELRALAGTLPGFSVHFGVTRATASAHDEFEGRLDADNLHRIIPDLSRHTVLACGPSGFVERARQLVGSAAATFLAEAFTPAARDASLGSAKSGKVSVRLERSQRTLSLPRGTALLDALEAEGIRPASGCRMGICNTCACGKREGTTRQLHTGETEREPVTALRLCVNAALTDLVLDL